MQNDLRLHQLSGAAKLAVVCYLTLLLVAFVFAALMSHNKYQWSDRYTQTYYLGESGEDALLLPKSYEHLLGVMHVHAFTMPLVFLSLWLLLNKIPWSQKFQKPLILTAFLGIAFYNMAPWLTRFYSAKAVILFTLGGIGMFVAFLFIFLFVFVELIWGKRF